MAAQPDALYTHDDLYDFPDDGRRRELVDGVLLVSPLARADHQRVVGQIVFRIRQWIEDVGHGEVFPGVNVDLAADTHLEPDVAWAPEPPTAVAGYEMVPAFVVEVGSASTAAFDRETKLPRYARDGAREVWLVDLDERTVEQFLVTDGTPGTPAVHRAGDTFTSPLFDGLTFTVDDLLG